MSSDIFSLQAIENISVALGNWQKGIVAGLKRHTEEHNEDFLVADQKVDWHLRFLGYITQQYTAKRVRGVRQPVKAYDRIIRKIPTTIQRRLIDEFTTDSPSISYDLGQIPSLHSLIPLSQNAHRPIFSLTADDGIVGAHFAKVKDSRDIFEHVAKRFLENLATLG